MKEKKHIDQLFKDGFENFEPTPSPRVWENIQAKLDAKKEDRKVIPLWWRLGGVAALLALLFMVGSLFFSPSETQDNVVTTEKEGIIPEASETNKAPILSEEKSNDSDIAAEEVSNKSDSENATNNSSKSNTSSESASENNKKITRQRSNYTTAASDHVPPEALAVEQEKIIKAEKASEEKNLINKKYPIKKDAVALNAEKSDSDKLKTAKENNSEDTEKRVDKDIINKEVGIAETTVITHTEEQENKEIIVTPTKKKSLLEEIEKAKKAEEVVAIEDTPAQRWTIAPNVAPVYYSSLGDGSSIDPMFEDNAQGGNTTLSYGVQVAYQISDRLSVRSGISNVDLRYSTGDIIAAEGPESVALRGVDHNGGSTILTAFDQGNLPSAPNGADGFGMITPKAGGALAELNQDITYYEVPLELKYTLLNKRFGVNLIGGFSTLFLGNNEISIQSGDFESVLGEANNLSSVSFTSNVGLGFGYRISNNFKFNIEPMFKYQLNPYTDSSVNFRPYYVGVYSGLSIQF